MTDYDSPTTFRGQLRRGRGIAVQRAATEPDAAEAVYECVFEDLRWDRPCDERGSYLAGLIHRLDLSLTPIERHLDGTEDVDSAEHTFGVLALLPFVGRADAVSVLRRYAVEGRHREAALDAIDDSGACKLPGLQDGLAADVAAAYSDDQLAEAMSFNGHLWTMLGASQPRIRRILDEVIESRTIKLHEIAGDPLFPQVREAANARLRLLAESSPAA